MISRRRSLAVALAAILVAGCAAISPAPEAELVAAAPVAEPEPAGPPALSEAQVIAAVDLENSLFFESGVTEIDAAGMAKLRLHAERLKADPKLHVKLIGYTDNQGSHSYNLAIAEQRVMAAYEVLRGYGVRSRQLRRQSVGGEKARKSCQSVECRSLMRRVELVYLK
jgi:peptidoglycan-associated lipoprotein